MGMNPHRVHDRRLVRYIPKGRTQKHALSFSNIEKLLVFTGAGGSAAVKVALREENAVPGLYFDLPSLPALGIAGWHTQG